MRALLLLVTMWVLPALVAAQTYDKQKIDSFASAIAHAEGFNVKHSIPAKYHNPGDIKSRPNFHPFPGQKAIGKGGHIIFKTDKAGWDALNDQIKIMIDGRSKHFNPNMTIVQVAKRYAQNWKPWVKIVTHELNVNPNITLKKLLTSDEPEIFLPLTAFNLPPPTLMLPTLAKN